MESEDASYLGRAENGIPASVEPALPSCLTHYLSPGSCCICCDLYTALSASLRAEVYPTVVLRNLPHDCLFSYFLMLGAVRLLKTSVPADGRTRPTELHCEVVISMT